MGMKKRGGGVEAFIRKIKSILNKLTIEKFSSLSQQLLDSGIDTQEHIEILVNEIFAKATMQHHFIEMYTELCIMLIDKMQERVIFGEDGEPVSVKRVLLNQCQESFQKYLKPPEGLQDLSEEEAFEASVKYKTTMLGNMKFVGTLIAMKVLSSKVISNCIEVLLEYSSEDTLETLCVFLAKVGPTFDTKDSPRRVLFADAFQRINKLLSSATLSARTTCLLKNLCDLRANSWRATGTSAESPKKMAEVQRLWVEHNTEVSTPMMKRAPR